MRFLVDIECDNEAFVGDEAGEVSRILRRIADQLEEYGVCGSPQDINGNTVGVAGFELLD